MKKFTSFIGGKTKKKLKVINLQFTILTGFSDNNIMIKTAPNRHTDHASERETHKGTRSALHTHTQSLTHSH